MIKFFRQIRFKLMSENKTSKYFKYAIGEIVLVVIGILIALQINNWNSERLESNEKIALMKSMKEELIQNLNQFKERKKNLQILNSNTNTILSFSAGYQDAIPMDSLKKYLAKLSTFPAPRFETTLLSSAKSSGKINLLDDELKIELTDFQISLNSYEKFLDALTNSFLDENWYNIALKFGAIKDFQENQLQEEIAELHPEILNSEKELKAYLKNVNTYKYIYRMFNENIIEVAWISEVIVKLESCLHVFDKQLDND